MSDRCPLGYLFSFPSDMPLQSYAPSHKSDENLVNIISQNMHAQFFFIGFLNTITLETNTSTTLYCVNMSHIMRKPVFAVCEQQRHRSACASVQSDQGLYCSLLR